MSDSLQFRCSFEGCNKICSSKRSLDQHVVIHSTALVKRKKHGAAKRSISEKKKGSRKQHSHVSVSSLTSPDSERAGTSSEQLETNEPVFDKTFEEEIKGETAGESFQPDAGHEENLLPNKSEDELKVSQTSGQKRKYNKRRKNVCTLAPKRRKVTLISETVSDRQESVQNEPSQQSSNLITSPAVPRKERTLIVESDQEGEEDLQTESEYCNLTDERKRQAASLDQPSTSHQYKAEPLQNVPDASIEVLYCETLESQSSHWLEDINSLNVEDLSFIVETTDGQNETGTVERQNEEDVINSVVYEVVNTLEQSLHEVPSTIELPDEEDNVNSNDIMFDFLLLNPIPEEDPYDLLSDNDMGEVPVFSFTHDQLVDHLAVSLKNEWIISSCKNIISLSLLTTFQNVSVQRSISWDGKDTKIFIHNKPLPMDNILWNSVKAMDAADSSDVADHLIKISYLVKNLIICKGIQLYSNVWKESEMNGEGKIESSFYQEVACFRATNCSLLTVGTDLCQSCYDLKNKLKHRSWRSNQEQEKDVKKINIKYLSEEEAKTRLIQVQEEKRKLQKRVYQLKKTLAKFVEEKNVSISSDLSNDLAKIFKENYNNLTPIQKLFWGEQLKSLSNQRNPRQIRWNPFIIKVALHIQMISSASYEYLKNFINLPSQRTLYDFTHYIDAKEGPQEATMQDMQKNVQETCHQEHEKYFNLIFDEMDVKSDIVINRKTGEVVGYTNLSKVEEELAAFQARLLNGEDLKPEPAKKLLVYMALGVTTQIQDVVAVYTTSGSLTAGQLYARTWHMVYRMENYGMKVLCLICDGASTNKKFFRMHLKLDSSNDFIYSTHNIACGEDRPIFFMVDPVHVLKSLRNNFANSYAHKNTRKMWKNGEALSWKVIELLYTVTQKMKYKDIKLTKAHIKLTAHSCMKVIYAAQVMSRSVAKALSTFKSDPIFEEHDVDELINFIIFVNDWFDCFNGSSDSKGKRIKGNKLLNPYTDADDERFDFLVNKFLDFFEKWYKEVLSRPGNFSKDSREKMFISIQTYESIQITTHGFINAVKFLLHQGASSIDARKFLQDKLEQFFGLLRMSFGGNRNPTVAAAIQKIQTLHVSKDAAKPAAKGNIEVESQVWLPDEKKLCKRPRKNN